METRGTALQRLEGSTHLALAPGETNETFIREVDENLRRSQAENFFKRWGKWLIAAAVLLLVGAGAYLYWQEQRRQAAAQQSQQLASVIEDIGGGRTTNVDQRLAEIAQGPNGYAGLAQMTAAAYALQRGDRTKALATYKQVAEDDEQPEPVRRAAMLRATALEFDALQPQEVIARLQEIAKPGNPWFGTAGEMTAMAMLKQNRRSEAGRLFGQIAGDRSVPGSIRSRAVQIAGTLGVDATAQLTASQ